TASSSCPAATGSRRHCAEPEPCALPEPAATAPSAALPDLEAVAVGVLELGDVAPGELEHVREELDTARLQLLDRLAAVVGLDRDRRRGASHRRLGLAGRARPQDELEVVAPDADGQKP